MRDPILGAILAQDEMIDRKAEQISKERGIKDPVEARIEAIAYARSGNGIIDLLARKRDEIIDARIRAKEEAAHNFLVSQGWDGVDTEKAKEIAGKFICEEHPDGTITFREKTEEEIVSEELLPCPFCGEKAEYSKIDTSKTVPFGTVQHFVTCKNNCLESLYARGNTKEEAIKAWNRRPSPWHTGKPTESVNKDGSAIPYLVTDKTGKCYDVSRWHSENGGYWGVSWFEVFAWRKIEPYNP